MTIIIGSVALNVRAPGILNREPGDFDFISSEEEMNTFLEDASFEEVKTKPHPSWSKKAFRINGSYVEFELVKEGSSTEELRSLILEDKDTVFIPHVGHIPSLDMLFTIKESHKYLKNSPHFWKTAADWHKMRIAGAKVRPEWESWLSRRKKETYHYKHPRLKATSGQDFFDPDQGVKYVYDHDSIHRAIALQERPAYTYYMKDGEEVDCDKEKFFSLPEEFRLNGVIEESCVLAIERSLVPFPGKMDPKKAWLFALSKVCTSITSGWFRKFAFDNLFSVLRMYPENYWETFQQGLESGIVLPFNGKKY